MAHAKIGNLAGDVKMSVDDDSELTDELEADEVEFVQRMHDVRMREEDLGFEAVSREYRQIETEFVAREANDESEVAETKRRITESLLDSALRTQQPQKVCRELWDEMLQRGFSGIDMRHSMGDVYARCCQENGEFDTGIAVLTPLITELEQLLQRDTLTPQNREFCEENLRIHRKIVDELKAGIRE